MYAVIATGGKQYRVEKDSLLKIEKLDAAAGS
ncbi:MAG: bL21 family ribosomal protein, partial [Steroidobacteraceae bacterium]